MIKIKINVWVFFGTAEGITNVKQMRQAISFGKEVVQNVACMNKNKEILKKTLRDKEKIVEGLKYIILRVAIHSLSRH